MAASSYQIALESLSPEHQEVVKLVGRHASERIAPLAADVDATGEFPAELYKQCHELGLIGLLVPEEDGGVAAPLLAVCLIYEELARASAALAVVVSNSVESVVPLARFANAAVRTEFLERVLVHGDIPCFALTEPSAGSDATAITTRATRTDAGWVLNGRKVFITNGARGGLFTVIAVTDPEARKSRRLSAFVVDRNAEGFSIGASESTMGLRGSPLTELIFDDVRLPETSLLGEVGQGLPIMMDQLNERGLVRRPSALEFVSMRRRGLSRTRASGDSSVTRSPTFRPSSSCWPTWRSGQRLPAGSPLPRGERTTPAGQTRTC